MWGGLSRGGGGGGTFCRDADGHATILSMHVPLFSTNHAPNGPAMQRWLIRGSPTPPLWRAALHFVERTVAQGCW